MSRDQEERVVKMTGLTAVLRQEGPGAEPSLTPIGWTWTGTVEPEGDAVQGKKLLTTWVDLSEASAEE